MGESTHADTHITCEIPYYCSIIGYICESDGNCYEQAKGGEAGNQVIGDVPDISAADIRAG